MGSRGAGCRHDTIKPVVDDGFSDFILLIGGTGKHTILGQNDIGKTAGILRHGFDIYYPGNVDSAVADKDADPRFFQGHLSFFRHWSCFDHRPSGLGEQDHGLSRRTAPLLNRIGNVFWSLPATTDINPFPGGFGHIQRIGNTETVIIEFQPYLAGQFFRRWMGTEADRKHHQVKGFFPDPAVGINISQC